MTATTAADPPLDSPDDYSRFVQELANETMGYARKNADRHNSRVIHEIEPAISEAIFESFFVGDETAIQILDHTEADPDAERLIEYVRAKALPVHKMNFAETVREIGASGMLRAHAEAALHEDILAHISESCLA